MKAYINKQQAEMLTTVAMVVKTAQTRKVKAMFNHIDADFSAGKLDSKVAEALDSMEYYQVIGLAAAGAQLVGADVSENVYAMSELLEA